MCCRCHRHLAAADQGCQLAPSIHASGLNLYFVRVLPLQVLAFYEAPYWRDEGLPLSEQVTFVMNPHAFNGDHHLYIGGCREGVQVGAGRQCAWRGRGRERSVGVVHRWV